MVVVVCVSNLYLAFHQFPPAFEKSGDIGAVAGIAATMIPRHRPRKLAPASASEAGAIKETNRSRLRLRAGFGAGADTGFRMPLTDDPYNFCCDT